jgi:malate dehydrogenase
MKITIVGAGSVGSSCAEYIAIKNFASEIVLLDIKENFAEGKSMDLMQASVLNNFNSKINGVTNDYSKTQDSDIAVITSGIPRKPGMSREELININAKIVKNVANNLLKFSPNVIIIVVSNPMDTMTYLTNKVLNISKRRIIGMGGILDSARFKYRISEQLLSPMSDIEGMVIGAHSDKGMIPLSRFATKKGIPISNLLSPNQIKLIENETKVGGATLTKMLGTSAWYAPGAAVSSLVQSIACNQLKMYTCSVLLSGEYGFSDISIGVPVIIGRNGVEEIVELKLNSIESEMLKKSVHSVKLTNGLLESMD